MDDATLGLPRSRLLQVNLTLINTITVVNNNIAVIVWFPITFENAFVSSICSFIIQCLVEFVFWSPAVLKFRNNNLHQV